MDIDAVANYFGIHSLHFEHRRAVSHFLNGKDVFIVLPTGFGKSFCFQCLPLCLGGDTVIIVISPLIALIKDQVGLSLLNKCTIVCVIGSGSKV